MKDIMVTNDKIKQLYHDINYHLSPNWAIGNAMQVDMSGKQMRLIYNGIRLTYVGGCFSISGKLYNNYMSDGTRGIKKIQSKTISIGLKVINM